MITPDIKAEWLPVIGHVKKQCEDNRGFALVSISIPVFNSCPVPAESWPDGSPGLGWLSIIRHLQAACSKNVGLAIAKIKVAVIEDSPVIWEEAELLPLVIDVGINRIRPMKIKGLKTVPDLVAAVACFLPAALTND
jgi:hypothetical protein